MSFVIHQGDALTVLRELSANSFDACLTDPPYGLGFMGKAWDRGVPPSSVWAEVLRVLKPGAMLLAFGGTRTHHRLMCAIEDAGFGIRDCCMWLYGSGFPKSLDISKALDKQAGEVREIVGTRDRYRDGIKRRDLGPVGNLYDHGLEGRNGYDSITAPATDAARAWDGYGTALKPAWEPIILAMKPCEGTFAENALKWGVAGLSIDSCRIPVEDADYARNCSGDRGHAENRKRALDFKQTAGSADEGGRWPANLILDEESASALDKQSGVLASGGNPTFRRADKFGDIFSRFSGQECTPHRGADSGGASRFFYTAKASRSERNAGVECAAKSLNWSNGTQNPGSFQSPNTDQSARNNHPTVKPVDLNRYLASLILPPKRDTPRRLLVPFAGSGSEILGAMAAGWDEALGIEISEEYIAIAEQRIAEMHGPLFAPGVNRPDEWMAKLGAEDLVKEDVLERLDSATRIERSLPQQGLLIDEPESTTGTQTHE